MLITQNIFQIILTLVRKTYSWYKNNVSKLYSFNTAKKRKNPLTALLG